MTSLVHNISRLLIYVKNSNKGDVPKVKTKRRCKIANENFKNSLFNKKTRGRANTVYENKQILHVETTVTLGILQRDLP